MNIGRAQRKTGLSAKTLRYYEAVGLVVPRRQGNGYRDYDQDDIHRLRFVQRARTLGFSVEDCQRLLALWQNTGRSSRDVKHLAREQLDTVERKIEELQSLRTVLAALIEDCRGDDRPECPIIDDLAKGAWTGPRCPASPPPVVDRT